MPLVKSPSLVSQDSSALTKKQKEMTKISGSFTALEDKSKQDQEALADAQKHFHAVSAGLSRNTEGEDASLNDQLMGRWWGDNVWACKQLIGM